MRSTEQRWSSVATQWMVRREELSWTCCMIRVARLDVHKQVGRGVCSLACLRPIFASISDLQCQRINSAGAVVAGRLGGRTC